MGKVTWGSGISAGDIDGAERSQFKPYDGPTPPNAMYAWRIKVLKKGKSAADNTKLIIGLELTPRQSRPEEKRFKGFYVTESIAVVESMAGKLGAFLDAIGVSGSDFMERTKDDGEKDQRGNVKITRIGKWVNDGKTLIMGSIADDSYNGETRKRISNFWPVEVAQTQPNDDDEDDSDDEEEAPAPKKASAKKASAKKRAAEPDDEEDDEDDEPPVKKKAAKKAAAKRKAEPEEDAEDDEEDDEDAPF